ncbi:Protein of unknown function [Kytococcus aerolatus]|uniref:DUF3040 domain-containing protein n=1 Tax=Kytococcus aerolatus TaxID=592308 RepID=A0A212T3R9_9MICO|nr:DUF3040 domain-containing protein [Kytococcus aerolatus]SNC60655.1 Protein of unknown function [Kytococcus aerolatus]
MSLSDDERRRLAELERSLLSPEAADAPGMPESERAVGPEHDPFAELFGSRAGATPAGPPRRRSTLTAGRMTAVAGLMVLGLALYAVALTTRVPWWGAGGFVAMVLGVALWLNASQGPGARGGDSLPAGGPGRRGRDAEGRPTVGRQGQTGRFRSGGARPSGHSGASGGLMRRLEERWDTRRDQQGA